jgi:pseudaminic acid cytidylyltransferase
MGNIAIIPARGGSKRIPRKNIKLFKGRPIIAYSIEAALQSQLFDQVMVSTDDAEIAEIAKQNGAEVPFLRSSENSNDLSGTAEVLEEVLLKLKNAGKEFKYACCIYPTAPFVTPQRLKNGYDLLIANHYKSVYPVCAFSYPIQRGLAFNGNKINMMWPENYAKRSQDLPKAYHDAGQFYWLDTIFFLKEKKIDRRIGRYNSERNGNAGYRYRY